MRRYSLPAMGMLGITALTLSACSSPTADAADPAGPAAGSDAPITIATLPVSDDPTQVNPVEALVELLEAETGREVEVTDVPDYLSVVEAIRADHVDIGIMSGFPSALAVNTGEVDAGCQPASGRPRSGTLLSASALWVRKSRRDDRRIAVSSRRF